VEQSQACSITAGRHDHARESVRLFVSQKPFQKVPYARRYSLAAIRLQGTRTATVVSIHLASSWRVEIREMALEKKVSSRRYFGDTSHDHISLALIEYYFGANRVLLWIIVRG
jgi:hypothetical protein